MKSYKYNKDNFEFYTSDGSCVSADQIEDGNIWAVEIFPPNQSEESFEKAQYSGAINMNTKDFNISEYPENWTYEQKKECDSLILQEIKDIKEILNK